MSTKSSGAAAPASAAGTKGTSAGGKPAGHNGANGEAKPGASGDEGQKSLLGAATTTKPKEGSSKPKGGEDKKPAPEPKQAQEDEEAEDTGAEGEEGESADEEPDKKPGAEDELKFDLPEGASIDEEAMNSFKELVKTDGLTKEAAQKYLELSLGMQKRQAEAAGEAWQKQLAEWDKQTREDPEIGGAKLQESLTAAKRVVEKFGGADLMKVIDVAGLGSHPVVIKALAKIGRAMSEDSLAGTGGEPHNQVDEEQKFLNDLYPTMAKKR